MQPDESGLQQNMCYICLQATPSDADPIDVKKKQNRQIHEEERDHIAVSKEGPQTQSNPDPSTTPSAPVVTEPEATKSTGTSNGITKTAVLKKYVSRINFITRYSKIGRLRG